MASEPRISEHCEKWNDCADCKELGDGSHEHQAYYEQTLQAAAARMKRRGSGAIVLTASTNSFDGEADLAAYNASKAGVLGILHTSANELGPYGIRVNAVCPGATLTPFHLRRAKSAGQTREDLDRAGATMCLLGRWADAREVAWPILWLASDEASFITGSVLMVDGGQFTK